MHAMDTAQRRARLAVRHRLAHEARTADVVQVVRSMVALHATDPATVFLSTAARGPELTPGHLEAALYDRRELVRLLGMRRTMFVVPTELVPVLQAACADALAVTQHRNYTRLLSKAGVGDGDTATWLDEVAEETHSALLEAGSATGAQLGKRVPRLATKVDPTPEKAYSKPGPITTWVLVLLGAQGRIVRGRPGGTWAGSQYRWEPIESWLPAGVPAIPLVEARATLLQAWLRAFGPAPFSDLVWWTGWSQRDVTAALTEVATVEVDLDGVPGLLLADDLEPVAEPEPWAALLPHLDPTPMGWKSRDWYLGPHGPALFDRFGNIGPTVWWNGRIVGGWAQRRDGELAWRLLEEVGAEAEAAITAEAERMRAFYGGVRAIPRFRTPLEKELSS
ncbi:winged helix DNA-binding domain-containing protein [Nocardia sp. NPDC057227]|uniref:winged helix DNA-binding domain-containing protein n=1 Tax=Nocardia sp. NPDC057227 TaxID=3346056 RepID=UPI003626B1DF